MKSLKRGMVGIGMVALTVAVVFSVVGTSFAQDGGRGGRGRDRGPVGEGGRGGFGLAHIVIETAAESVGMEPREFLESIEVGQTLSEAITANGGDPVQVAADAKAAAEAQIDEALANERITEERAAEMKANLDSALEDALSREGGERAIEGQARFGLRRIINETVLEVTGLDRRELSQALNDGQTLADIITANGGDVEAVKAEIIAEATTRLSEAVEEGRLSQEDADAILEDLEQSVEDILNFTRVNI